MHTQVMHIHTHSNKTIYQINVYFYYHNYIFSWHSAMHCRTPGSTAEMEANTRPSGQTHYSFTINVAQDKLQ